LALEVLDQLCKHIFEHSELDVVVHGQDLDGDGLVDRQNLLDCWAVVPDQDPRSLFELALLKVGFGELHQVGVQDFVSLLFS